MGFLDPYAVDGATITGAQLRREVFAYTKGATGVDGPEDLKVVAVDGSPGLAGILPGGGKVAVESRRESYSVTNTAMDGDALIEVPPAGSSGATHYVIVEVADPQYHGQEMGVEVRLVSSLSGLTRPSLPLARIDLEPGEGFEATSEVTDLRVVATPRRSRIQFAHNRDADDGSFVLQNRTDQGQSWPNLSFDLWQVDIPEWATRAIIQVNWHSVLLWSSGRWGNIWARLGYDPDMSQCWGHVDTGMQQCDLDDSPGQMREYWSVADTVTIPEELRGTRQPLRPRARRRDDITTGNAPRLNPYSAVSMDIEFLERAN